MSVRIATGIWPMRTGNPDAQSCWILKSGGSPSTLIPLSLQCIFKVYRSRDATLWKTEADFARQSVREFCPMTWYCQCCGKLLWAIVFAAENLPVWTQKYLETNIILQQKIELLKCWQTVAKYIIGSFKLRSGFEAGSLLFRFFTKPQRSSTE